MRNTKPGPSETLLAHKAIALCTDLTAAQRRVAAAIVDHYNRRTTQCDPSVQTLAELLGISRRTVIRATQALEQKGYLRKHRHGGKFHRNSYEPAWERFRGGEEAWTERRSRHSRKPFTSEVSPSSRLYRHLGGDSADTQTCLRNQSKETYPDVTSRLQPNTPSVPRGSKGPAKVSVTTEPCPIVDERFHVKSTQANKVLRDVAERRWNDALMDQFRSRPEVLAQIIEVIDEALSAATTEAELRRRGSGSELILNLVKFKQTSDGAS